MRPETSRWRNALKTVLTSPVWLASYLILAAWDVERVRRQLGKVFLLLRAAEHDLRREEAGVQFALDPTVRMGYDTMIYGKGSIEIGKDTYIGRHGMICADPKGSRIHIGRDCALSHNVQIRTGSYSTEVPFSKARVMEEVGADIVIEDSVFIGANVFIRGGVHIGSGAVVGANSVVVSDLPANSICGGVPARVLRQL